MTDHLYRIAKVEKFEHGGESYHLVPGKWGDDEAARGEVLELHRPDGIVVLVPVWGYAMPSQAVILSDVMSFDLVTPGTEVRVRHGEGASPRETLLKRGPRDKRERPQFVGCEIVRDWGRDRSKDGADRLAGSVVVWAPMHPLLEWTRRRLEKEAAGGPFQYVSPVALAGWKAELGRLESAAEGDEERIQWRMEDGELVTTEARKLVLSLKWGWISCPACGRDYKPAELHESSWFQGSGLSGEGGAALRCPKEHGLFQTCYLRS